MVQQVARRIASRRHLGEGDPDPPARPRLPIGAAHSRNCFERADGKVHCARAIRISRNCTRSGDPCWPDLWLVILWSHVDPCGFPFVSGSRHHMQLRPARTTRTRPAMRLIRWPRSRRQHRVQQAATRIARTMRSNQRRPDANILSVLPVGTEGNDEISRVLRRPMRTR